MEVAASAHGDAEHSLLQTVVKAVEQFFVESGALHVAALVGYHGSLVADSRAAAEFHLPHILQSASASVMCCGEAKEGYLLTAFKQWIEAVTKLSNNDINAIIRGPRFPVAELLQRIRQQQQDAASVFSTDKMWSFSSWPSSKSPAAMRSSHAGSSSRSLSSGGSSPIAPRTPAPRRSSYLPSTYRAPVQDSTASAPELFRGPRGGLKLVNSKGKASYVSSQGVGRQVQLRAEAARRGV